MLFKKLPYENENNREKLLQIMKNDGIFGEVVQRFSLEKIKNSAALRRGC